MIMILKEKILEELKDNPGQAGFELSKKLSHSVDVIRNSLNDLKRDNIIIETRSFKKDLESKSNRGYKTYSLNPNPNKKSNGKIVHLLFLMKFFQKNKEILQENNRDFFIKNKDKFIEITQIIKESVI